MRIAGVVPRDDVAAGVGGIRENLVDNSGWIKVQGHPKAGDIPNVRTPRVVLVVEDEGAIREIVVKTLEKAGYGVISARDPGEAYEKLGDPMRRVDVLFTDIALPVKSGTDFAADLVRRMPGTKVIFATGSGQLYKDELAAVAHERLLQKPYSAAELREAVHAVLEE